MEKKQEKAIVMAVYTSKEFNDKAEEVLRFAEKVVKIIYMADPSLMEVILPWQLDAKGHQEYNLAYMYTPARWDTFCQIVLASPHALGFSEHNAIRKMNQFRFQAIMSNSNEYIEDNTSFNILGLALQFKLELFQKIGQETCISLYREMVEICDAVSGYFDITSSDAAYDLGFHTLTIYLAGIGQRGVRLTRLRDEVPGYCWGLLLTEDHLEKLGGMDMICQSSVYPIASKWNDGARSSLFLQASEDVTKFSKLQRLACKQYLKPLLPREEYLFVALDKSCNNGCFYKEAVFTDKEREIIKRLTTIPTERLRELYHLDEAARRDFMEEFMNENF